MRTESEYNWLISGALKKIEEANANNKRIDAQIEQLREAKHYAQVAKSKATDLKHRVDCFSIHGHWKKCYRNKFEDKLDTLSSSYISGYIRKIGEYINAINMEIISLQRQKDYIAQAIDNANKQIQSWTSDLQKLATKN